jgi:hypothetical protein
MLLGFILSPVALFYYLLVRFYVEYLISARIWVNRPPLAELAQLPDHHLAGVDARRILLLWLFGDGSHQL